jgi:hypothetical protein
MAPCTCKIADPIVLNGECLICRGERPGFLPEDARELLGWSAALETRHVSFDNWQREQGAAA